MPLFQGLKDYTRRVDSIPLTWVHTVVFETNLGEVLNGVGSHARALIIIKHAQDVCQSYLFLRQRSFPSLDHVLV